MSSSNPPHDDLVGVGFGLRWDFLDELLERLERNSLDPVPFFEIAPENYMRRGGYIPESLALVTERIPIITHGLMMSLGGLDAFDAAYFAELRAFAHRFRTPWHSDHLCFSGVDGRVLHDLLPIPQTEAAAAHVAARVREARDRLELPMAIENISYYLQLGEPELEETELIGRILEDADCGLLLDVNNVYVNAKNHGFDARAWIERIDLNRVMQIHVAGHEYREQDGLIIDTHGAPVIDPVYDLLTWTIARTGPKAVILERDNDVPDLDEMLSEWRRVRRAYDRGLELWQEGRPQTRPPHERHDSYEIRRMREAHRVLDFAVRTTGDDALAEAQRAGFPGLELAVADAEALRRADPKHVRVYRRLVRGNLLEAIENQLPLTRARLGRQKYEDYVVRFCEEELPRSAILRDVAYEFAAWATPLLSDDPDIAAYLPDLMRYELLEFDVYTAVRDSAAELRSAELLADAPIAFDTTVRLGAFAHAVHALPDDPEDRTVPAADEARVLAYRDAAGRYRELELTPLAGAICARLLLGESFAPAVRRACAVQGVAVDETVISGTSVVLADLAERGAVLGAAAKPPESPPSPFFAWLLGPHFVTA